MNIRRHNKDHLREYAPTLQAIKTERSNKRPDDELVFWTKHEIPQLVDLRVFTHGDDGRSRRTLGRRVVRPFTGRPNLIIEVAPALRALLEFAAPRTVGQYLHALRDWWRLFDSIEDDLAKGGLATQKVQGIADIGEIHRQRAFDDNMDRGSFGAGLAAINIARTAAGMKQLLWSRPSRKNNVRQLPPESHVREVRIALKHGWFATIDRWQTTDELLKGREPIDAEERRLLRNYKALKSAQQQVGHPLPGNVQIMNGQNYKSFYGDGLSVSDMYRGYYPDAEDIRYAFYLCIATTGWNPSVLLNIDANSNFIEAHPKDPTRYLLRAYKARSRSEQYSEGLFKSQGSAGVVLQTLFHRTAPLRAQLQKDLKSAENDYLNILRNGGATEQQDALQKLIGKLRIGVSSIWLYVTYNGIAPV